MKIFVISLLLLLYVKGTVAVTTTEDVPIVTSDPTTIKNGITPTSKVIVTKASDTSTSQSLESTMKQSTTPLPMSPTSAIEITMDGSSSSVSTSDHVTTPLPMSPTSAIEVTMEGSSSPFSTSDPVTTSLLMSPTSSIEVTLDGSSPSVSTSDHVTSSVLSTTTGNSEPVEISTSTEMPEITSTKSTPITSVLSSSLFTTDLQSNLTTEEPTTSAPSQCKVGFVTCKDGRCEPYESLCGTTGAITTTAGTTIAPPSTMSSSSMSPTTIASTETATLSLSPAGSTEPSSSTISSVVTPGSSRPPAVVNGTEVCRKGWERCQDGTCEPFHWLCEEHGMPIATVTTMPQSGTTYSRLSVTTMGSSSKSYETAATTMPLVPSTTIASNSTQKPGGSEICLHGWESCKDGTCEPFHWLCEEHDSQPIGVPVIGR